MAQNVRAARTVKGRRMMILVNAKFVENCKCFPVIYFDEIEKQAVSMSSIMIKNNGIGLAAPQVGIFTQFFIMKDFRSIDRVEIVINPEIIKYGEKKGTFTEGCLTYPGETFFIKRSKQIKAKWFDIRGIEVYRKMSGKEAQVFQHEYDHLQGISCKNKGGA